jgi:hypothetical protein
VLSKALLYLIAFCLTGCATQSIPPAVVLPPPLVVPTSLKEPCAKPEETNGKLANLAQLSVDDARNLADCAAKHGALVTIINDYQGGKP